MTVLDHQLCQQFRAPFIITAGHTWAVASAVFSDIPNRSCRYLDTVLGMLNDAATVIPSRGVNRRYVGIAIGLHFAIASMRVNSRSWSRAESNTHKNKFGHKMGWRYFSPKRAHWFSLFTFYFILSSSTAADKVYAYQNLGS